MSKPIFLNAAYIANNFRLINSMMYIFLNSVIIIINLITINIYTTNKYYYEFRKSSNFANYIYNHQTSSGLFVFMDNANNSPSLDHISETYFALSSLNLLNKPISNKSQLVKTIQKLAKNSGQNYVSSRNYYEYIRILQYLDLQISDARAIGNELRFLEGKFSLGDSVNESTIKDWYFSSRVLLLLNYKTELVFQSAKRIKTIFLTSNDIVDPLSVSLTLDLLTSISMLNQDESIWAITDKYKLNKNFKFVINDNSDVINVFYKCLNICKFNPHKIDQKHEITLWLRKLERTEGYQTILSDVKANPLATMYGLALESLSVEYTNLDLPR